MRLILLSTNRPEAQSFRILWICRYPSFQSIPTHLFTPQQISRETGINRKKQQCLFGRLRHCGVLSRLIACRHERNLNWLIEQTSVIGRDSATKTTQCGLSAYMQCFWKRNRSRLSIKPARRNGIRFFRKKSVDNTLSFNEKKNVYYTWTHAHSSVRFVSFSSHDSTLAVNKHAFSRYNHGSRVTVTIRRQYRARSVCYHENETDTFAWIATTSHIIGLLLSLLS